MIPTETTFADTLVRLLGEDKAKVVLGVNDLTKATDTVVRDTLQKEGLFTNDSGRYLFVRLRNTLSGQRSILSVKPEYATPAALEDDITLYFDALFGTKDRLSKEGLSVHKKVAEIFLLPLKEKVAEENNQLYEALVKDLAVFLSVVAETTQMGFTVLDSDSSLERRMASLIVGDRTRVDKSRIVVSRYHFTQLESAFEQQLPHVLFSIWFEIKQAVFHEALHFIQVIDSELMLFLSTFVLRALYDQMQEQIKKENKTFGPFVRSDFYMLLPHETETYIASAFVEQLGRRMSEQYSDTVSTIVKCLDSLEGNYARLNSHTRLSLPQKVTYIESSVQALEVLKNTLHYLEQPITNVTFGWGEKSDYHPSPVDILGIVTDSDGLRAVSLQYARSGFYQYAAKVETSITTMIKEVIGEPQLGAMLMQLNDRLQKLA